MPKVALILTLAFLIVGAAGTEESRTTVLCLGDSLTEGFGVAPEDAWPQRVQRALAEKRAGVRVINAGISGATSASAVPRLKWQLKSNPDIVILELGANDGLRGVDPDATRRNLREAIVLAQASNVTVLLAGMKLPPNYGEDYTRRFERIFPELAKEMNVALIPFLLEGVAGEPSLNLADRIHPNPKGYQRVAETVLEYLMPLL